MGRKATQIRRKLASEVFSSVFYKVSDALSSKIIGQCSKASIILFTWKLSHFQRMSFLRGAIRSWANLRSTTVAKLKPTSGIQNGSYVAYKLLLDHNHTAGNAEGSSQMLRNAALCMAFGSTLFFGSSRLSEPATNEAGPVDPSVGSPTTCGITSDDEYVNPEIVMEQVKIGIEDRLKSLNLSSSTLSPFTISAKGQQVSVKIPVSPLCDLWCLIVDVISHVGRLTDGLHDGKMTVSASERDLKEIPSNSAVAQVLTLERAGEPYKRRHEDLESEGTREAALSSNALCIWVFEPLIGEKFPEIEFLKKGHYSDEELDLVVSTLRFASSEKLRETPRQSYKRAHERRRQRGNSKTVLDTLEAMGVKVYGQEDITGRSDREVISWDNIAGYHQQKREIEDTVLLALRCPDIYDSITRGTRCKFESNRPRAVLFEGPPGTGKTSSARVIATQAGVPLLYVPLEAVMSKYYGESERMLGKIFDSANELPNGAIIFLDEVDSIAMTRDSEMHEATRRMLSVLLRQIDGFEQDTSIIVIAATNRKEDLDPALISRFDASITFDLPDQQAREEITAQYARHLTSSELTVVAAASDGMSGRDIRDICQQAERHWASKLIRNHAGSPMAYGLPPIQEYIDSAEKRRHTIQTIPQDRGREFRGGHLNKTRPTWPPSVVV